MCGRFTSLTPPEDVALVFGAQMTEDVRHESFTTDYNVAPSKKILVVAHSPVAGRQMGRMRWGLVPSWTKELRGTGHVNARSETVAEKPSFRDSFRKRRCVIPMDGYYEWRTIPPHGLGEEPTESHDARIAKRAVYVTRRDKKLMAVAGLWASWTPRDIESPVRSESLVTCCVITTAANELLASVHDRMPVILEEEDWSRWLGETPEGDESGDLSGILQMARESAELEFVDVGSQVNSVRNNGPELISPRSR